MNYEKTRAFKQLGLSNKEYENWCRLNNLPANKLSTKKQLFDDIFNKRVKIKDGKIVKGENA